MTKTQSGYTPGEWVVDPQKNPDGSYSIRPCRRSDGGMTGFQLAVVEGDKGQCTTTPSMGGTALGNAHLIAASPKLLAALETVLANVCQAHGLPTHVEAQAHAAIAKAKGKA